jgi:hypothetical protein
MIQSIPKLAPFSCRHHPQVVGSPTIQETEKGPVIVIPARINANLKAKTMEEVIAQRKDLHMSLVKNVTREIARDIKVIEESDEFIERAKKDFSSKNAAGRLVRSVTEECEHIVDMHASKDVVWYNNDRNYARWEVPSSPRPWYHAQAYT